ncbi:hypothetical protein [Nocardiopsis halophila]|uniref:hypothetical protein n=1 Tax=Nocardiopsis halophila TaxID=141692 RepID=UPI000347C5E2|nr:hypothetical protein [Nocardiopsis halophila]
MPIPQPRHPRTARTAVPAALIAAVALGGCSAAGQAGQAAAPSPSPSSPPPLTPNAEEMEDLDIYCRADPSDNGFAVTDEGQAVAGYPAAPEYEGEGLHHAAVFTDVPTNNAERSKYRLKEGPSFDFWLPSTPEEVELVVCLRPASQGEEKLDDCEFEGGGEISDYPLYEQTYEYTVYSLHSGEEAASGDIAAGLEKCPFAIMGNSPIDDISEVYTGPDHVGFTDEIQEIVEGEAP